MKFPRTPHMTGSKATSDDIWTELPDEGEYIAFEKIDGSNIMMNNKKFITRKGGTSTAEWTYPARLIHNQIAHLIPKGIWLAGELMTWRKSIAYDNLPGEYIIFGAMKGNKCLAWDEVREIADTVGLPTVRQLTDIGTPSEVTSQARGIMDESMEGFVIRPAGSFSLPHYNEYVAKFVGAHHEAVATNNGRNGFEEK